jgi:hypothetical protein
MINSPVAYNIFKRPEISKIVFNSIKLIRPKKLYIFSDGPRNDLEKELVLLNRRQIISMIDWECDYRLHFLEKNIGFTRMWEYTFSTVFKEEDRIIVLEEDILPSVDFFLFCDEMLEMYKDDSGIYQIGGVNSLIEYPKNQTPSYFFNDFVSSWGLATWKRSYLRRTKNLGEFSNGYYSKVLEHRLIETSGVNGWIKDYKIMTTRPDLNYDNAEFWFLGFNEFLLYNSLAIIPSVNLVKNMGNSRGAENSDEDILLPKRLRKPFNAPIKKLDFPLTHPKYRVQDNYYSLMAKKGNQLGVIRSSILKIERGFRILFFAGHSKFFQKLMLFLKRKFLLFRFKIKL